MLNIKLGMHVSKGCNKIKIGEELKENHFLIKKQNKTHTLQNMIDSKTSLQYFAAPSEVLESVSQCFETMLALRFALTGVYCRDYVGKVPEFRSTEALWLPHLTSIGYCSKTDM